jgi:hypothetical protein
VFLAAVLIAEARKGFIPRSGIPVAVRKLKSQLDPTSTSSIRRRWGRLAFEAEILNQISAGTVSADEAVRVILNRRPELAGRPHLKEEGVGTLLLGRAALEVFCSSLERKEAKPGTVSVSGLVRDLIEKIRPPLRAKYRELRAVSGAGGIPPGGPAGVARAIPFLDSLAGVGNSVSEVFRSLPSGEFLGSGA